MSNQQKNVFEISVDTRMVYDRMKQCVVGEVISYRTIGEILGRAVDGSCSNVQSALYMLERDGVAFANVRGTGYQRMDDVEIVGTAESVRKAIRRKAERGAKRLTCVQDFGALPNELKVKHNAALSGFGAIASIMSPGRMKSLEASVEKAGAQLPLAKTLEAFKI